MRNLTEEEIREATKFWINKFPSWFKLQSRPIQYEMILAYFEIQDIKIYNSF